MKFALPLSLCLAFAMTACNTLENRRSMYAPKKGDGPYTRSLQDGSWKNAKSVDEEYQEGKRQRTEPKLVPIPPPAAKPAVDPRALSN